MKVAQLRGGGGESKSLRRPAEGAHSLLACLLCHSLLMQPLLSDYSREGRRRNREGGEGSQPAAIARRLVVDEGLFALQTDGRRRKGETLQESVRSEVCNRQSKESPAARTDAAPPPPPPPPSVHWVRGCHCHCHSTCTQRQLWFANNNERTRPHRRQNVGQCGSERAWPRQGGLRRLQIEQGGRSKTLIDRVVAERRGKEE